MGHGKLFLAAALATVVSSAATAGGLYCILSARNVLVGRTTTDTRAGAGIVLDEARPRRLTLAPDARILRVESVTLAEVRPGETVVAALGDEARSYRYVALFKRDGDLQAMLRALGSDPSRR